MNKWERLRHELKHLIANECHQIDPVVVLAFMMFLEEIESHYQDQDQA